MPDDVRGVRLSRHCRVEVRGDIGNEGSRPRWLAATTGIPNFRAAWVSRGSDEAGVLALGDVQARRLEVASGDILRILDSEEEV